MSDLELTMMRRVGELNKEVAALKAEVNRLEEIVGSDAIDRKYGMCCDASDEVARLKAEVERTGAENSHLHKGIYSLSLNVAQLKDEVERLTKAGDSMAELMFIDKDYIGSPKQEAVVEWCKATEAKEGKPSA